MNIRNAVMEDYSEIMEIYRFARQFMAANGNPTQWGTTKPYPDEILKDINDKSLFVCEENGKLLCVFFYSTKKDPTYNLIDGKWLDDNADDVLAEIAVANVPAVFNTTDMNNASSPNIAGKADDTANTNGTTAANVPAVFNTTDMNNASSPNIAGKADDIVNTNGTTVGVVHRIASAPYTHGAATFCLQWAYSQCGNLKIDTHENNFPMQGLLKKLGFTYCGTIYLADGSPRRAYQKR